MDNTNLSKKLKILRKRHILVHKKIFFSNLNYSVSNNLKLNYAAVVECYLYNKKPYQLLLKAKSLFNHQLIIPGTELLTPGKIIYNFTKELEYHKPNYLGSQILLKNLPYYISLNFLNNNFNNKPTFAKSSGTYGIKLKAKKTVKLILIKLPSTQVYHFINNTKGYIGKNTNFFNNKYIEGK
jgi:ribosomal protein L2